jgi:hypothetical protein
MVCVDVDFFRQNSGGDSQKLQGFEPCPGNLCRQFPGIFGYGAILQIVKYYGRFSNFSQRAFGLAIGGPGPEYNDA